MKETRTEILPGVFVTCLQTDKFKTGLLSINFLTNLCREETAQNTLIPSVLRRGSVHYPDMDSLAARLDDLYGARIEPIARKYGEIQSVGFWADFVDDAFLPGENSDLLEQIASLLGEILLSPNTRGGLLLPQYVESEKEKLLEDIRARMNDKIAYSRQRLIELMCSAEAYSVDVLGTEEEVEGITYLALTKRYRKLLSTAPIEIFYCGTAGSGRVEAAFQNALMTLPRSDLDTDLGTDIRMNTVEEQTRTYVESMDVTQAKLAIGFRLGSCMEDPNIAAIRVMNTIYGGGISSKLFMNVREKLSLCYFASSGVDIMKGIMFVISGIEPKNCETAQAEIFRQLDAVRDGDITEEELATAKISLISDLRAVSDSNGTLEGFWLNQNLLGLEYGPDDLALLIEEVTLDDVVAVANSIECDMIYLMKNEEAEADEEN